MKCVKIVRVKLTGFWEGQVERSERKKNYKASQDRDDILTEKLSALHLGPLYLPLDNKHNKYPWRFHWCFWLQSVSGKSTAFSHYAACSCLPLFTSIALEVNSRYVIRYATMC